MDIMMTNIITGIIGADHRHHDRHHGGDAGAAAGGDRHHRRHDAGKELLRKVWRNANRARRALRGPA